jgi:hypothetical protein
LVKNQKIRRTILAIILSGVFLIAGCGMMVGAAITAVIQYVAECWTTNWDENWQEVGLESQGSGIYYYTIGAYDAFSQTVVDTVISIFTTDHKVDGKDAMNQELGGTDLQYNDYEQTVQSIANEEALIGQDGALLDRINIVKSRVLQRGEQISDHAMRQYALEAIGLSIGEYLASELNNPILFFGVQSATIDVDMSAFQLSDIQAIKILAAYSIQHDCDLTDIDMFDLMDYCGWYEFGWAPLEQDLFGDQSIYEGVTTAKFQQDIGGVVADGDAISTGIINLTPPKVPYWRGTFAPQWYYEEIAQIKDHNDFYFNSTPEAQAQDIPWGVTGPEDSIDISQFHRLSQVNTFGLIDKLYSASHATLSITRTEYHGADELFAEALSKFTGFMLQAWTDAYGPQTAYSPRSNVIERSSSDEHSYTLVFTGNGMTKGPSTSGGVTTSYSYYLRNESTGTLTSAKTCTGTGQWITFGNLVPATTYTVFEKKTTGTEVMDPQGNVTINGTSTVTQIDSFTTIRASSGQEAYELILDLKITFSPRSMDSLVTELMGLWPGSFQDTVLGDDGLIYAEGHKGNEKFLLNWEDTYTAPDGSTHTLQFHRMYDHQVAAYKNIAEGMAVLLGLDPSGLYDPSTTKGNDIVAVANAEYEYYHANNLKTGTRYWEMVRTALGWTLPADSGWCVAFVYCCAYQCGYVSEGGCFGPNWVFWVLGAYDQILRDGDAVGYDKPSDEYKPVPGDIIFFGTVTGRGDMTHIGIVEYVDDEGGVHIIHGNSGNSLKKTRYPNYEIGSTASTDAGTVIAAYLHPNYPDKTDRDPVYLSISGLTGPMVGSRYAIADNRTLILSGVTRLRWAQLQPFLEYLKQDYPELYSEELQADYDAGKKEPFMKKWNEFITSGKSAAFRKAQLEITLNYFITPFASELLQTTDFNWSATTARAELMWGLYTMTDQPTALKTVLTELVQGIDKDIPDTELLSYLKSDNYLGELLSRHSAALWPNETETFRLSWIKGMTSLVDRLMIDSTTANTNGMDSEFYFTISNPDPTYQGHAVPNLTPAQIAAIKNTLYGEYGSNLEAMLIIAQSIRDNVDRAPSITYDNFVTSCKYYGGYPERSPDVYETENVNKAFDYIFVQGKSAVQCPVYVFYAPLPSAGLYDDSDFQALFLAPLNFIIQVGTARFFNWDL